MTNPELARRSFLRGAITATAALAAPVVGQPAVEAVEAATLTPVAPETLDQERWQACLTVARMLLLVGPRGEDLKLTYLKTLIEHGLPRTTAPKKVLIVGAGISGMVAGWLLRQPGHDVVIEPSLLETPRIHAGEERSAPFFACVLLLHAC
jgi:monoamine oxidase